MAFFQATGLLGTFNTIVGVLLSIRKCYKAKKKIPALVDDCLSSLENIKLVVPHVSRFVEVGGIGLGDFCVLAGKLIKIEVDLVSMEAKLNKMNKIYRLCSAPESFAALESVCNKFSDMETESRLLITLVRADVKVSVLLEAFEPVLAVSKKSDGFTEKQQLLADAQKAFGTHILSSHMNRLISRNTESVYYFIMGKLFYEGVAGEVDYEKSASFFQRAISYGNREAFGYLGKQFEKGLGMIFEVAQCFEYGYGVEKDEVMGFEYFKKAASAGHAGKKGGRRLPGRWKGNGHGYCASGEILHGGSRSGRCGFVMQLWKLLVKWHWCRKKWESWPGFVENCGKRWVYLRSGANGRLLLCWIGS